MKVIYEKHISTRIMDAVYEADLHNRRIGYIEVTVKEADELSKWLLGHLGIEDIAKFRPVTTETTKDHGSLVGKFYGVDIRVEQKP
jgi:hypothetical protein